MSFDVDKDLNEIAFPSIEDVEEVCYPIACEVFIEEDYRMPGLRGWNKDRMEAALGAAKNIPDQTIASLGAHLAYYTTKGHAFLDGNKRMTLVILYSFLAVNDFEMKAPIPVMEVVQFIERVTASKSEEKDIIIKEIENWIIEHFISSNADD